MIYVLGGSNPLNFRVLDGTTQPANLKENDVWVNTSTKITSWDFSATEPRRVSNNKNLIVYPFYSETGTSNGITWTDNKDGTVNANGTASKTSYFRPSYSGVDRYEFILKPGTYHLSGCQSGGSQETFYLQVGYSSNNWEKNTWVNDYGSGSTFTVTEESVARVACVVVNGTNVSNITFKPQLEKGSTATSFVKGDATGQVWFPVDTSNTVEFNALKKNSIQIYPLSAKQYVNGAWVEKPAKVYKGGVLTELWDGHLYRNGDEYDVVTGGWIPYKTSFGDTTAVEPKVTKNANSVKITITQSGSYGGALVTKNKVSFKGKKRLVFTGSSTGENNARCSIMIWSQMATNCDTNRVAIYSFPSYGITNSTVSLDVTSLEGEYYVGLYIYTTGHWIEMTEMKLE